MTVALPASALELLTEENPPFNFSDQQHIKGISSEVIAEMGQRANIPMKMQVTSWQRAYNSALNTADTCVFSTVKLPERESLFKWIGPVAANKWALFAKSDFSAPLKTINDARAYRIGGVQLDAKALYLKSLGFTNFDLVGDDNLNLMKLKTGRIDLWVSGLYKGMQLIAESPHKDIKPVLIITQVDYFLACNPNTPPATIDALNRSLHTLQKEGFVKQVIDRYAAQLQR